MKHFSFVKISVAFYYVLLLSSLHEKLSKHYKKSITIESFQQLMNPLWANSFCIHSYNPIQERFDFLLLSLKLNGTDLEYLHTIPDFSILSEMVFCTESSLSVISDVVKTDLTLLWSEQYRVRNGKNFPVDLLLWMGGFNLSHH